mmetsp:Transcript_108186/g.305888  ORF Transcript_108186/g.305888 Transcript_108186/m.305888 type:complete len:305 (+) Transcript_108186:224-1138(+)
MASLPCSATDCSPVMTTTARASSTPASTSIFAFVHMPSTTSTRSPQSSNISGGGCVGAKITMGLASGMYLARRADTKVCACCQTSPLQTMSTTSSSPSSMFVRNSRTLFRCVLATTSMGVSVFPADSPWNISSCDTSQLMSPTWLSHSVPRSRLGRLLDCAVSRPSRFDGRKPPLELNFLACDLGTGGSAWSRTGWRVLPMICAAATWGPSRRTRFSCWPRALRKVLRQWPRSALGMETGTRSFSLNAMAKQTCPVWTELTSCGTKTTVPPTQAAKTTAPVSLNTRCTSMRKLPLAYSSETSKP